MSRENRNRDGLFRIAGLLGVIMIGMLLMGCGLALAFGNYSLSTILFCTVVALLVAIKVGLKGHDT